MSAIVRLNMMRCVIDMRHELLSMFYNMYFCGADGVSRTPDLLITNQLLYQLSYASVCLSGVFACKRPGFHLFLKYGAYDAELDYYGCVLGSRRSCSLCRVFVIESEFSYAGLIFCRVVYSHGAGDSPPRAVSA